MRFRDHERLALPPVTAFLVAVGVAGAAIGVWYLVERRASTRAARAARSRLDAELVTDEWLAPSAGGIPDSAEAGAHVP